MNKEDDLHPSAADRPDPSTTAPTEEPTSSSPDPEQTPVGQHPGEITMGPVTRGGNSGTNPERQQGDHPGEIGVQSLLGGEESVRGEGTRLEE